jgi:hypothetical protein
VQSVHARQQLVFAVDDGRVLTVDVSRIPTETQRALAPGDTATMIGVAGRDANHFIAQSIHEDTRGAERHEGSASPGVTTAVPRPRATVDATQVGRLQRLMLPPRQSHGSPRARQPAQGGHHG